MIICSRCGTKNNDNFNCCYNCGTPLNKNSEPANEYNEEESIIAPIPDDTDVELSDSYEVNDNSSSETSAPGDDIYEDDTDNNISAVYSSSAYMNQQTTVRTSNKKPNGSKQPSKKSKNEIALSRVISILVVLLVVVIVIWGTIKLLDSLFSPDTPPIETNTPPVTDMPTNDPSKLNAEVFTLPDTDINGDKFFRVAIKTNGDKVYVMNNEYTVENGEASFVLTLYDVYSTYRPTYIQKGELFNAEIPVLITKQGFANYEFKFTLKDISTPMVPIQFITPTELNSVVYKTNTTLSFSTRPDSTIYLNGEDYTNGYFNSETGIFTINLLTPPSDNPYRYEITIESDDYLTRTVLYELTRSTGHDPNATISLKLDDVLYTATEENLVTITGCYTGAHDTLSFTGVNTDLVELVSINFSDDGDGTFAAVLKCTLLGWSEIRVECKTDSTINNTVYVRNLSNNLGGFEKYTTTAWGAAGNYNELMQSETKHNGKWFLITGSIKTIEKVETGYAIYVNITPNQENETLVYVELCTDSFTYDVGRNVRIFANRSMNHDGVPRFLSAYCKAK